MSTTTGEIQSVTSGSWLAPQTRQEVVQSIMRVAGAEGGTTENVRDFSLSSGANFSTPSPEFSAEVITQIESFLKENTGIELNFVADGSETIVQVVEKSSGKVIRQIPAKKVARFRGNVEQLRGILFDGKA
ncbi:MAG TPA: flagellar protein FlaG [Syntrophobacteraceae bacterium]|nr:flagellar protein FlaG [Syntrophobacteraceae bacterium]